MPEEQLQPLLAEEEEEVERPPPPAPPPPNTEQKASRVASLDVFRGLCVFLMMLVDYGGSILPVIAHSPWNGLHLADFVMPFFLFIVGVSLALVYKKVSNRTGASWKAFLRALKLFLLGVLLQGGYFHGINSLTYGVDINRIRWLGILQRISIGYIVAALCEIWLSCRSRRGVDFFKSYAWHWCAVFSLSTIYMVLSYGLYVPDWQFEVSGATSSSNATHVYTILAISLINPTPIRKLCHFWTVQCSRRGDLGPACNSAGMIDRYVVGIDHLYAKPVYKNLKECNMTVTGQVPEGSPSWCHAPSDPEGLLGSLTAAVTCIIGLQFGHILAHLQDHKGRLKNWSMFSVSFLLLGLLLAIVGIPANKSLYTISYMLITSAAAGLTFSALYLLVDVYGFRRPTYVLEWMGIHSLSIFILVTSNLAIIAIQGLYWTAPENNLVHWVVSFVVQR